MDSGLIGFDNILDAPDVLKDSVAASSNGEYVVSSSVGRGTFLEHKVEGGGRSIKLFKTTADRVGFFGKSVDLVAVASGDTLRILHLHKMKVISTIKIRPFGLFVPASGNSTYIGVVSPKGKAYLVADDGEVVNTPLTVAPNYEVVWSSNVSPVGYTWNDENAAYIYIKSTEEDKGATLSSTHGMSVFTTWYNRNQGRHEVYMVTFDEPHILKRVWAGDGEAHVDNVVVFRKGTILDNLVTMSNGRPSIAAGFHNGVSVARIIPPETRLATLLKNVITAEEKSTAAVCMGTSSYVSWTQTPITPAVPAIVNYSVPGRPRYEIYGGRPRYTQVKNNSEVDFTVPTTNSIHTVLTSDHQKVTYRYVSPLPEQGYTSDVALVIVDEDGIVSAGSYSPTVKMCYELGIPVAILPVVSKGNLDHSIEDTALDLVDVSRDIVDSKLAKKVVVLSEGRISPAALHALTHKKSEVSSCILYHLPAGSIPKRLKKPERVTVVFDSKDEVTGEYSSVNSYVLSPQEELRQVDVIDILTEYV